MGDMRTATEVGESTERFETLVNCSELARRLGVTERFVRRLVEERRVPFVRIGRFVRFDPAVIDDWVLEHRVDPLRGPNDLMTWWR
jgi:excisionase family DNA binding protein